MAEVNDRYGIGDIGHTLRTTRMPGFEGESQRLTSFILLICLPRVARHFAKNCKSACIAAWETNQALAATLEL